MAKSNYICPDCGAEMNEVYERPALNLVCPRCGCKIATTRWEEIDLDDTTYEISVFPVKDPSIEQIKFLSKITGNNFLSTKEFLKSGGKVFEGSAVEVFEKRQMFMNGPLNFTITPDYKY